MQPAPANRLRDGHGGPDARALFVDEDRDAIQDFPQRLR